jgi:hypothetical protein
MVGNVLDNESMDCLVIAMLASLICCGEIGRYYLVGIFVYCNLVPWFFHSMS